MSRKISIILVVLMTASIGLAEPELKGSPSELSAYLAGVPRPVALTGKSEVKAPADQAVVKITVRTEGSSLEAALKANQDLRVKMLATLKKSGIPSERIVPSKFSSTPQYGFFSKRPSGYKVENLVKITIKSEKDFQEVAKIVDSFREVDYEGIEFELSNKTELKAKVTEQACDAVLKKKKMYEEKFDIKLVARSFVETDVSLHNLEGRNMEVNVELRMGRKASAWRDKGEERVVSFGEIAVRGYTEVVFVVENNSD